MAKPFIYPRALSIAWSANRDYWSWSVLETDKVRGSTIEAVVLKAVCWLDVAGKYDTKKLTPKKMYEVVFVVKLEDGASGWETLVKLKLNTPNKSATQKHNVSLKEHIGKGWVDIPAGKFETSPENMGEISFSLSETESGWWKSGLVVKGVAIRLKN